MNKKLTFGKLAGIIFCILAAACTVVLLFVNAYFGGQMKLIDKYYTALERDDFDGYKACIVNSEYYTEEDFAKSKEQILILQDNENVHAKAEFIEREKNISNGYWVRFNLTVYNENEHTEIEKVSSLLVRINGKWLMDG